MLKNDDSEKLLVFITVGNCEHDFQRIYSEALSFLKEMSGLRKISLIIQSGHYGVDVLDLLQYVNDYKIQGFISTEEFDYYAREADVYISHCGVGSILKRLGNGRKPIVLARDESEHIDAHQKELFDLLIDKKMVISLSGGKERFDFQNRIKPVGIKPPKLDFTSSTVIAVSSVGGHKVALEALTKTIDLNVVQFVDEKFVDMEKQNVNLFPSCASKLTLPVRVFQAALKLRSYPRADIYTTGAGVGLAFAIAGKFLGRKVYVQESMTRIVKPSKWFFAASRFADVSVTSPWARFRGDISFRVEEIE